GGPALYLFPWIWAGLMAVLIGQVRGGGRMGEGSDLLPIVGWAVCADPLTVQEDRSARRTVRTGPSGRCSATGRTPLRGGRVRRRLAIVAAVPLVAGLLAIGQARWGVLGQLKAGGDPTVDLFGWDQVARELGRRGLSGRPGTFLFTSHWFDSGQLAFATGGTM